LILFVLWMSQNLDENCGTTTAETKCDDLLLRGLGIEFPIFLTLVTVVIFFVLSKLWDRD
jgi:hypothetical protein